MSSLPTFIVAVSAILGQTDGQQSPSYKHLKALEATIGKWSFEGPTREEGLLGPKGTLVCIVIENKWAANKGAIIGKGFAEINGTPVFEALDVTSWDPASEKIVTNSVSSDGNSSRGEWSVDGTTFSIEFHGVKFDGTKTSATNIVRILNKDSYSWEGTRAMEGGKKVPDAGLYELTRVQ